METDHRLKDQFLLDPEVVFLNHGSYGACPRPVFEKYQELQRRLEKQPVQFLGVELDKHLLLARQELAKYLHTEASALVFITNATHGVNIVARSILLKAEDEILTTDQEYGACNYAWENVCQKTGAKYKKQAIRLPVYSEEEIVEQFWQGVSPRTKVVFLSHIASPTSLTLPIEKICLKARQAGILSVIDGAHAPGQIELDLPATQADFYTGNCHKWMMSPKGAGFLYARQEVQHMIEPLIVSWGYPSRSSTPRETAFIDLLQWTGTKDPSAALSVPAAIEFMQQHQWDVVRKGCHELLRSAMERLCEWTGQDPLYPLDSPFYHQMGTFPIPQVRDVCELKARLYDPYKIEIPCFDWNNRQYIRLSVQGYNSADEIDLFIQVMKDIIPEFRV